MGCPACVHLEVSGAIQQGRWFGAVLSGLCFLSALVLLEWPWAPAETAWSAAVSWFASEGQSVGPSVRGCVGLRVSP